MSKPSMTDRIMRRVFHRTPDPVQRARTAPPQQWTDKQPLQSAQGRSTPDEKRNSSERPRGLSPPLMKTVVVPITASMEFRDKRKQPQQPGPPPLPTSPRPPLTTNPTGLQGDDERRRPRSPPVSPRNEGFRYPGSELPGRKPSLRGQPRRYGDDLPVFNNGIGGGPLQRYPIMEDSYFPGQSAAPSSSRYSADAQPPPKRPGRPDQYLYSRNL